MTRTEAFYEQYWADRKHSGHRYRYDIFLHWIAPRSSVLDVGCGDGYLGEFLKKRAGAEVVGVDVSEVALGRARERGIQTTQADITRPLPFPDKSHDYVIATEVLEHVPNSEEVLRELARIAKRAVLVSIPNTGYWKYRLRLLFGRFPKQWLLSPSEHLRFWCLRDFRDMCRGLNLRVDSIRAGSGRRYLRDWFPGLFAEQLCFRLEASRSPHIFVNSYAYVYDRHIRLFDFFRAKSDLTLILPRLWKAKGGKIRVEPVEKAGIRIVKTWSPFYHSHYPVIRGMLKGWMPFCGRILRRLAQPGDVLLSSAEPNLLTTYLYARLARRLGMRHVFLTWQNISYRKRLSGIKLRITEWLLRKNFQLSAGGLFGTRQALELHKDYIPHGFPVAIVPQSGVDVEIFTPDATSDFRSRYGLEGKIIYLFGAVFDERKGVFTTIRAFRESLKEVPDGHLVMIGIGKLWQPAKDLVCELDVSDRVTFLEWMPNHELPGVFASVDMLVHPSEPYKDWEEQYGWTMLQAESSGLPVIATDIGAISEAVVNGVTGILIPPADVQALAGAMIALARDPERRRRMGEAGRGHILKNFSHKVIAERLEAFLHSLS